GAEREADRQGHDGPESLEVDHRRYLEVYDRLLESIMHQDRTIVLQGRRFHYTEWGAPTAPALIMLHGLTGHARTWDEEAAALASRYRVLALDQRGHGDSDPAPHADYTVAALSADLREIGRASCRERGQT